MDITLKNVKIYAGLSQSSDAFTASVYVDGKKVGEAKDDGRGGNNYVDVRDAEGRWHRNLYQKMQEEAAKHTQTYEIARLPGDEAMGWGWSETYPHNLDSYIRELLNQSIK